MDIHTTWDDTLTQRQGAAHMHHPVRLRGACAHTPLTTHTVEDTEIKSVHCNALRIFAPHEPGAPAKAPLPTGAHSLRERGLGPSAAFAGTCRLGQTLLPMGFSHVDWPVVRLNQ